MIMAALACCNHKVQNIHHGNNQGRVNKYIDIAGLEDLASNVWPNSETLYKNPSMTI